MSADWLKGAEDCLRGIEENKYQVTTADLDLLTKSSIAMSLLDIAKSLRRLADAAEADR